MNGTRVRRRRGRVSVRLPARERELLEQLASELAERLDGDLGEPDLRRLFPPAYADDPAGEDEYRRLVGDDLLDGRRRAVREFAATLGRAELSDEELESWLTVLNDLRLVLGTRLDVDESSYDRWIDPRDPRAPELAVYLYLSWLQEQVVEAARS